ncbi:hypothetical protein GQ42DRAFT_163376 [Ramicandelaber brevisporus]|nr:hypothetical protein GQ42DRAFT_163376 [Ramicandelaber brevisporus]
MSARVASPAGVIKFLHLIEKLKRTPRTGWIKREVAAPESISDHMHRMGVMAMLVDDPELDRSRCIKMAIVHDIAESIVGDITPHCGVSNEDKHAMERHAINQLCSQLYSNEDVTTTTSNNSRREGDGEMIAVVEEIRELWNEYEEGATGEAKLVKDIDKFEMIVQAMEYEKSDGKDLSEFFESTKGKFRHPQIKAWAEALYAERAEYQHQQQQQQ